MARPDEALHMRMLVPYLKLFFVFLFFFVLFGVYCLSDTKCDLNPSRLQRFLGVLVKFEHHLVPDPGR